MQSAPPSGTLCLPRPRVCVWLFGVCVCARARARTAMQSTLPSGHPPPSLVRVCARTRVCVSVCVCVCARARLHGDAVDVAVGDARHLELLDGRHPPLGEKDEALHVLLAPQPVDGRAGREIHHKTIII